MKDKIKAKEIAARLNLPLTTVNWRIHTLGLHSPYDESILPLIANFENRDKVQERQNKAREVITKKSIATDIVNRTSLPFNRVYYYICYYPNITEEEVISKCKERDERREQRTQKLLEKLKRIEENGSNYLVYPNYIFQRDILPLSQALKRGIYNDGHLNVFRDPNFRPRYILKEKYLDMLRDYFKEEIYDN